MTTNNDRLSVPLHILKSAIARMREAADDQETSADEQESRKVAERLRSSARDLRNHALYFENVINGDL